jgi:hypothetical protein
MDLALDLGAKATLPWVVSQRTLFSQRKKALSN